MSFPSRFSVLVFGSSEPGSAGSGICFTQTTMFIASDCERPYIDGPNRRGVPHAAGEQPRSAATIGLGRLRGRRGKYASPMVWHPTTSQERDRRVRRQRLLVALVAATFGVLMLLTDRSRAQEAPTTPPPPAAPTATAPGTTAANGTAVVGTLTTPSGPVAGARI